MTEQKKNLKWWNRVRIPIGLLLLLLFVACIWLAYWDWIIRCIFEKDSWATRGQFGDMFGALNALFSGLAFAGIIYTIRQQSEDLELQREELKLTRQELTKSAEAQKKAEEALNNQAKTMQQTALLNAYTSWIEYHQYVLKSVDFDTTQKKNSLEQIKFYSTKVDIMMKRLENPYEPV